MATPPALNVFGASTSRWYTRPENGLLDTPLTFTQNPSVVSREYLSLLWGRNSKNSNAHGKIFVSELKDAIDLKSGRRGESVLQK
jgi:hypothetical protein